jgi:hypothetical protein
MPRKPRRRRRSREGERNLETSLKRLSAYRRRDSDFERAAAAFAKAEVSAEDPLEGEVEADDSPIQAEVDRPPNDRSGRR